MRRLFPGTAFFIKVSGYFLESKIISLEILDINITFISANKDMTKTKSAGRPKVADKKIRVSFMEKESVYNKALENFGKKYVDRLLSKTLQELSAWKKVPVK